MFQAQFVQHQEALRIQQLVYLVRIMSADCYQDWSVPSLVLWLLSLDNWQTNGHILYGKYVLISSSAIRLRECVVLGPDWSGFKVPVTYVK
jgi:hypothetical protein